MIDSQKFTHADLIEAAAKWLQRRACSVVITDMTHGGAETPDAIGWSATFSTLIECKASRSDFLADAKKTFRREPLRGMGVYRYYCTPKGLIAPCELPDRWGLLEWDGARMIEKRKPEDFYHAESRSEISILLSTIRRIGAHTPKGVSVKFYTYESKNRATIGCVEDSI